MEAEPGAQLARRLRRQWTLVEVLAAIGGALVVLVFLHALHAAQDLGHSNHDVLVDAVQVLGYLALALPLGWLWRERRSRALWGWLHEDRVPTAVERDLVLREPLRELAAHRPPDEIVATLNRFFAIVVDVVEAEGGWVNKFEGDAALCVFGAPADQPDAAARTLAAARALADRLDRDLPELDAGIGVSAGPAVAGNVGSERRLEYTVVGDPVNEAARLCELAKPDPARALASGSALDRAGSAEAARWRLGEAKVLRGRDAPTRLAAPVLRGGRGSRSCAARNSDKQPAQQDQCAPPAGNVVPPPSGRVFPDAE